MATQTISFFTSTIMGRDENKKICQLLQSLLDSSDSFEFRQPVDWKVYGLLDYPTIIKKPMDLGTVKKNLSINAYETVEDCLKDISVIWQNCKTYNKDNQYYQKLSDKLDKMTKKMIKNYLPFVGFENPSEKKKTPGPVPAGTKKQVPLKTKSAPNKALQPQQPKTYQDRKQNQMQQQKPVEQSEFIKLRKQFLFYTPLCSGQQIGVIFMLIHKYEPQSIAYTQDGQIKILAEKLSDAMVKRLSEQMDMWGIGYVPTGKKK